jgi:nitroreductase
MSALIIFPPECGISTMDYYNASRLPGDRKQHELLLYWNQDFSKGEQDMDAIEALFSRRSIRKYKPDPIPEGALRELLEAAMSAPSAGNQQPWHFVIIHDRKILDEIPTFHPHSQMLKEAPIAVLVCGDLKLEKHIGYWVQDCAAATENLLLAVHAKGLGGVWLGIYPREDRVAALRKLLGIPEHVIPFSLVPVGYPAESKPPRPDRYNAMKIHHDKW